MSALTDWKNGNTEQKVVGFHLYFVRHDASAFSPMAQPLKHGSDLGSGCEGSFPSLVGV